MGIGKRPVAGASDGIRRVAADFSPRFVFFVAAGFSLRFFLNLVSFARSFLDTRGVGINSDLRKR